MPASRLKLVKLGDLNPAAYNPREIKPKHLDALKESLKRFGQTDPLIVNATTGNLVSGHQRLRAMEELGWKQAEVKTISCSELEEKALNIAMNSPKLEGEFTDDVDELLDEIQNGDLDTYESLLLGELRRLEAAGDSLEDPPDDPSGGYREQFGVIVMCEDEGMQADVYAALQADGYECKVVTT